MTESVFKIGDFIRRKPQYGSIHTEGELIFIYRYGKFGILRESTGSEKAIYLQNYSLAPKAESVFINLPRKSNVCALARCFYEHPPALIDVIIEHYLEVVYEDEIPVRAIIRKKTKKESS